MKVTEYILFQLRYSMAHVKIYNDFQHIFAPTLTVKEMLAFNIFDGGQQDAIIRRWQKPQRSE